MQGKYRNKYKNRGRGRSEHSYLLTIFDQADGSLISAFYAGGVVRVERTSKSGEKSALFDLPRGSSWAETSYEICQELQQRTGRRIRERILLNEKLPGNE